VPLAFILAAVGVTLVVLGWLVLGVVVLIAAPGLARRLGEGLARREGLAKDEEPVPA
jgi:hypothetical protein